MTFAFCPACAAPMGKREIEGHARDACTRCGRIQYRNSKPCVGAVITRVSAKGEREVLLSMRARDPAKGSWDLPGGFLEEGEAPEAGLAREVAEETGLARVHVHRLLGAWVGRYGADAWALSLVYHCTLPDASQPKAASDSAELRWWPASALPDMAFPHEREAILKASIQGP